MVEEYYNIENDFWQLNSLNSKKAIELFEEKILNLNSPELSYIFSKTVNGANIKAHEKVILESKDPQYNYLFAKSRII